MNRTLCTLMIGAALLSGCEQDPTGPRPEADRIAFKLNGSVRTLSGAPATGAGLLQNTFAVARADSLEGIVAIGNEAAGETSNLFVLQAPRATGTYECSDGNRATPCHGRYIVGVRNGSSAAWRRFFNVVGGSVTFTQVGPDRLRGTFTLTLRADDNMPDHTIEIRDGILDVPYIANPSADGALGCVLMQVGAGWGNCTGG